ncbi:MAG: tetratricopeptide repeat protein, partial [bacterium]|nr:tetratricopeptide repeat protein [bacterium]
MPDIKRLNEQAHLFYQKGEWEKARRAYEQLTMVDAENPEHVLTLANIYRETGEDRKALEQYEVAVRIGEKAGDLPRSIVAAKKILSIDKGRIELYNKAGELYANSQLKSGAVREWLRFADQLKVRNDFVAMSAVHKKITALLPENQSLKELGQKIEQMVAKMASDNSEDAPDPADIVPYHRLLDVAIKMGNPKKILETQLTYARVLQKRGFDRKSKSVYQKILEKDPNNEEALSRILSSGSSPAMDQVQLKEELFLFCKDFQDAVWTNITEAYERYYDVGMLYREVGLRDDAIADFQLSIKGGNRQLKGFEMLAISFLEQGDYGLASEVLNQGISVKKFLDNEYVGLHYNLGLANEQLGDRQKALDEYEQVYILDINYKDVAQRMRNLLEKNAQAQPKNQPSQLPPEAVPVTEIITETGPPLIEEEEPAVIEEEPAATKEHVQPEPETTIEEAGLEEEYQELTAFQAQAEETLESEMPGLDEEVQAEETFGDGTVEVIMDQPPSLAPKTE